MLTINEENCIGCGLCVKYLNLNPGEEVITCLVIGYPGIKYQRTVPRKDAKIVWR